MDQQLLFPASLPVALGLVEVSGPHALAQRAAMTLLLSKGTDPLDLEAGTDLRAVLDRGLDPAQVQTFVQDAVADAQAQMLRQDQGSGRPTSEQLASLSLVSVTLEGATLTVGVRVVGVDGQVAYFEV